MNIWYLAGPMTGIPKFNFPTFLKAAEQLRRNEFIIVSPAELGEEGKAMQSIDGDLESAGIKLTWGDLLARDVKLIADECDGIIFLDGWEKSRGARLEAFVGILNKADFARYTGGGHIEFMAPQMVLTKIMRYTSQEMHNV